MNSAALEAFLARLYTDAVLRARFLAAPALEARRAGLDEHAAAALEHIDKAGLCMAAASYARKRAQHRRPRRRLMDVLSRWLRRTAKPRT
jgi:hypothetical protein